MKKTEYKDNRHFTSMKNIKMFIAVWKI